MPSFAPSQLAAWSGGTWSLPPRIPVTGFGVDTRILKPGDLFVAIATEKRDGHDFLEAAQKAGASGAIVSRHVSGVSLPQLVVTDTLAAFQAIAGGHRRNFGGRVVGISGSAGKTSTKDLLALLLGGPQQTLATEGNLNNHLGVPLTLTRLDAAHEFAVIEAGIGGTGEMRSLADMISPDLAVITLVAPAHLAGFGSIEKVAAEKAILPESIRAAGVAIFPSQCLDYAAFQDLTVRTIVVEPAPVIRPASPPKGRIYFTVTHRDDESAITLSQGSTPMSFSMRRVSTGMAQNAALAVCAAIALGIQRQLLQVRLAGWKPAPLRGEWRKEPGRRLYIDCYNANPASMADALESFVSVVPAEEPRLYVIGGMEELGDSADEYHRALGRSLGLRPVDSLFAVGDQAAQVKAGALASGAKPGQIVTAAEVEEVAGRIAAFRGAIFIKGSRRWRLERGLGEEMKHAC